MASGRARRTFGRAAGAARLVAAAGRTDDRQLARRRRVDPDWRRADDGPARLGPRQTIDVRRSVGRFRARDPRQVHRGFAAPGKVAGLALWAGVVGGAWWLGSSRGRGPLAGAAHLDAFGSALRRDGGEAPSGVPDGSAAR